MASRRRARSTSSRACGNCTTRLGRGIRSPRRIEALLNLVVFDHLLYGTDFPFGSVPGMVATGDEFASSKLFNGKELRAVVRSNAVGMFPRLDVG